MKAFPLFLATLLACSALLLTSCAGTRKSAAPAAAIGRPASDGKSLASSDADDLDEYAASEISDPIEPLNRATFWVNHQLYRFVLKPVSKTYEFVIPQPIRKGIFNAFENIDFPVRLVNNTLQGNFRRAGQETGKFAVNTVLGVGGILRPSDKFPALAHVPPASTSQTFEKWGIGHGPYIVLPLLGPSSARDTVGRAGDYVLNPVTWVAYFYGILAWTIPVSAAETIYVMPDKFRQYDAATNNSLDRYLAIRRSYVQYSKEANSK
jgi:phospholipid-binding lipoprotein MlaA